MSLSNSLLKLRSSFWYLPSLYGFIAFLFALISLQFDTYLLNFRVVYRIIPSVLFTDLTLAQTILSTISASLLTMTTITFSTILVVLTTYLSEFSPRTLQNFITDQNTQRVLGIFVGGFVYSIMLLLLLKDNGSGRLFLVPAFAILFSVVCLFVFVFFIHHVSSWIQVSNLLHNITLATTKRIEKELNDIKDEHKDAPWEDWESEEIKHIRPQKFKINQAGYIQHIDIKGLVEQARVDDCIIRIEKKVNDYVDHDTPFFSVWTLNGKEVNNNYSKYISVGSKQAPLDDIEFGLTKIVEIALRALSPGINDPNTAIICIKNLGGILTRLGKKQLPNSFHNDSQRSLRLIYNKPTFSDYLYTSFSQIRQSGFHDISVLSAGIQSLTLIAEASTEPIKEIIWEFAEYIIEGIDGQSLLSLDKKHINRQLELLAKATSHSNEFEPIY